MSNSLADGVRRVAGWRAQRLTLAIGLSGILALSAGMVAAAIPNSDTGVINGCYLTSAGILRVIDAEAGKACTRWETPISWNIAGAPGLAGAVGQQGEPGVDGRDGADGLDGADGEPGPQGEPGIAGRDGASGAPGIDGDDGVDGEPGPQGEPGPEGEPGPQGEPGLQGPQGIQGATGLTGAPGLQGPAGGLSGYEIVQVVVFQPQYSVTNGVTASCPPGKRVLGGGHRIDGGEARISRPASTVSVIGGLFGDTVVTVPGTGWRVNVEWTANDPGLSVTVYAICANVS